MRSRRYAFTFLRSFFFGLNVLFGGSFSILHPRRYSLNSLPGTLALHHGNWLQENAVLYDLCFQIVTFLYIQRAPHFGGERELASRRTRMSVICIFLRRNLRNYEFCKFILRYPAAAGQIQFFGRCAQTRRPGTLDAGALTHRYRLLAQRPQTYAGRNDLCSVSEREFPISTTMTGAPMRIKPSGLRELHSACQRRRVAAAA